MPSCAATALKVAADMDRKETIRERKARQRKRRREVRIVMSIVYMLTSILIDVHAYARKLYETATKLVSNCTYAPWEIQLSTFHNAGG